MRERDGEREREREREKGGQENVRDTPKLGASVCLDHVR